MDRRLMLMENFSPWRVGCLPLPQGYIHVYDHNIQTSSSLKPLGQLKPNFHVEHPLEGGMKVYINCQGHMT